MTKRKKEFLSSWGWLFGILLFYLTFRPLSAMIEEAYKKFSWLMEGLIGLIGLTGTLLLLLTLGEADPKTGSRFYKPIGGYK